MRPLLIFALAAFSVPLAQAGAPGCGNLSDSAVIKAAMSGGPVPGLQRVRQVILEAARSKGLGNVNCDEISQGAEGQGLICYNGNHNAVLGMANPNAGEGVPLAVANFGDNNRREVRSDGLYLNGKKNFHMGTPGMSVLGTQVRFCESVLSGNGATLQKISNPGNGEGPRAVPAIYYGPDRDEPVLIKT
ncbi:MAG: hypothetical protein AUJ52_07315 [Elusimicrobia bacterium CG1_02_63_36]|nr:MAG: hypothetical protein AUJ52_07315 [Elusimicrobia bacterium CG1_02_63_36]PIP83680.1 MAG: hypothetical protein COR54_08240 [Elusimicrobia bacterium CG22_combo_CG10-13_8_21_14_all_63_91]PJA15589.1 MAG: hypothetical protein COX66_09720 [Elusimicrobia bacterium CG_4_10_14_0_2_um_filter_63_34]PJB26522.1 MAG: hypothetical protein CO113_03110 [Elusimicrobia bacterium CG_4_9_14_3_um_filter_62_55]